MGKSIQEITATSNLSQRLKDKYGGLKKFLERYTDIFVISTDHPFNPHIFIKSLLTSEDLETIARGLVPSSLTAKYKKIQGNRKKSSDIGMNPTISMTSTSRSQSVGNKMTSSGPQSGPPNRSFSGYSGPEYGASSGKSHGQPPLPPTIAYNAQVYAQQQAQLQQHPYQRMRNPYPAGTGSDMARQQQQQQQQTQRNPSPPFQQQRMPPYDPRLDRPVATRQTSQGSYTGGDTGPGAAMRGPRQDGDDRHAPFLIEQRNEALRRQSSDPSHGTYTIGQRSTVASGSGFPSYDAPGRAPVSESREFSQYNGDYTSSVYRGNTGADHVMPFDQPQNLFYNSSNNGRSRSPLVHTSAGPPDGASPMRGYLDQPFDRYGEPIGTASDSAQQQLQYQRQRSPGLFPLLSPASSRTDTLNPAVSESTSVNLRDTDYGDSLHDILRPY